MRKLTQTGANAVAGALWLALAIITFQRPYTVLPSRPRLLSPGVLTVITVSLVLMLTKSAWIEGASSIPALMSVGMVLGVTAVANSLFTGNNYPAYATVMLAASIGVDAVSISLSLLGVLDLKVSSVRDVLVLWELAAIAVAFKRIATTTHEASL